MLLNGFIKKTIFSLICLSVLLTLTLPVSAARFVPIDQVFPFINPGELPSQVYPVPVYWRKTRGLIDENGQKQGVFYIQRIGNTLWVTYDLSEYNCLLSSTSLDIETSLKEIPVSSNNFIPSEFKFQKDHNLAPFYTLKTDISDVPAFQKLFIAASAELKCNNYSHIKKTILVWAVNDNWSKNSREGKFMTYKACAQDNPALGYVLSSKMALYFDDQVAGFE